MLSFVAVGRTDNSLDSRHSLFDSNHFIFDTSPLFGSHGNSFPFRANSTIIGYFSDSLDRLATARERTSC